jgi:hypothetical protein
MIEANSEINKNGKKQGYHHGDLPAALLIAAEQEPRLYPICCRSPCPVQIDVFFFAA